MLVVEKRPFEPFLPVIPACSASRAEVEPAEFALEVRIAEPPDEHLHEVVEDEEPVEQGDRRQVSHRFARRINPVREPK